MAVKLGDFASQTAYIGALAPFLDQFPEENGTEDFQPALIRRHGQAYCIRAIIKSQCDCSICAQQFHAPVLQKRSTFSYESILSDGEAQQRAASLIRTTRANLQYLREQCEFKGNTIIKRWKKKSSEKRKALLLEVDPQMYTHLWSDIRFTQEFANTPEQQALQCSGILVQDPDLTQGHARRPYRNICMLPYMSLDSLKDDPAKLLNILNNRLLYSPEQWAPFDNYLLDKQWKIGSVSTSYNRNCIVMHGLNYGNLTPWQATSAHALDTIGFPRAILVLEAQMKLSEMLKAIIEKLVEGSEGSKELNVFTRALELGLKKATDKSSCVEFASSFMNQPFSPPPTFDIQSMLDIAQEQVNLHADHLWLLQTDPSFLRRYTKLVLDGGFGENLTIQNQHVLVALKLMDDAMTHWTWEWILQDIQKIESLYLKFRDNIYPGTPLPSAYSRAIGGFGALLYAIICRLAGNTFKIIPNRPGFRSKWDTRYFQRLQSMAQTTSRRDSRELIHMYADDPLEFCLLSIPRTLVEPLYPEVNDKWEHKLHEPSELFSILDDHLSRSGNKDDVARLDEILYASYSDLSALHQMLFMVRLHQPQVSIPALKDAGLTETGKAWRYVNADYLDQDHRILRPRNTEDVNTKIEAQQRLGNLMAEFLATTRPTGSRASQKWLDQDQAQREASGRFWAQMRSRHRQTCERIKIDNDDIEADLQVLSADLAPEHIADIEKDRAAILAKIAEKEAQKTSKKPLPTEVQTQWGNEATQTSVATSESRVKVKTRSDQPSDQLNQSVEDLTVSDTVEEPPRERVAVSKRNLEILQSLYPKPNFEERTKNVDWASFVSAMTEVGFAAKQIHGSEYSFDPVSTCKWYGKGRIVFHKPHPEPKYEAWKLLGIGKRMTKWFGWSADMFELLKT